MPITNYTAQDLLGVFSGVLLFTLVLVIPGYVTGSIFDLFDFKKRQPLVRFGIGLLLSCAISPILFFLTSRLVSNTFTLIVLFGFAGVFALILYGERDLGMFFKSMAGNRLAKMILWITILWTLFAAVMLVDIQWGNSLYFNVVAYDYSTRASVISAITHSGVPPINPSIYPGEPVKLTFLYYFWYILCSLVDQLGGKVVDSRTALMASVIWAGLALMATVALYLRFRNTTDSSHKWRSALIGIGLLAVSGLDILSSTFYMIFPQYLLGHVIDGDIEHWNEQVTAWVGTTMWTPHHLISLLNGILGWLLIVYHQNKKTSQKLSSAFIAGLAFASAFGLSSWVTLIFVIFWLIWMVTRLLNGDSIRKIWTLVLPGLVAAAVIFPFVLDLYGGGSGSVGGSPLTFDVRWFWPMTLFVINLPNWERMLVHLLFLPLNYFFELGFFLLVGLYWYGHCGKEQLIKNPYARGEIILLLTTFILVTFTRSTLISNNDFGWRGWLPGQFILLVWGTDLISYVWSKQPILHISLFRGPASVKSIRTLLASLLIIGGLTSLLNVLLLRTWPMLIDAGVFNQSSREVYRGKRVYEARTAYTLIDNLTPADAFIQSNPELMVDRPAGLYRTRNSIIAVHTLYGVASEIYQPLIEEVGSIFNVEKSNWQSLDATCQRYFIDVLIIKDLDTLWESRDALKSERQPLYMGKYYAVFYCGNRAS
jgi:hypothetical protein